MTEAEVLILVDAEDREIGTEEKLKTHQLGKLHRAFSVFIFRKNNSGDVEMLLQQRATHKYHCGGLWSNTCCSHPRVGEDIIAAGNRRLKEEMLIATQLYHVGSFCYKVECANGLIENELDHVLIGVYSEDIATVNADEVQAFRWVTLDALEHELQTAAQKFTPWFSRVWNMVGKEKINDLFVRY